MSQARNESDNKKCRIAELMQYTCSQERTAHGESRLHCYPILRIFRMCPNRPAVEITKLVNFDSVTGKVEIPAEASQILPKGKPWRDVTRYKNDEDTPAD
ncbi:hypothetical protein NEOLEDRAFT_1137499 [Neolentinus lepideus HHB14362 ss-1]|uniref:Uncharacterized protein n=1 Tax=Neolentinus lepideus HHB14362 ss-1 TaxID=1314782 RepID=A0A165QQ79_9AGAM|nr:hypothetical protein NEOLEDRAFT_1137499 [Neolentinus lepideus HHB14362 ss-1]